MSDLVPGVLDLLVCPQCHAQLTWDYEASELVCSDASCGLAYAVRGGIPVLVVEDARSPQGA